MEELTQEQIIERLNGNAELLTGVLDHVLGTEAGQQRVNTVVDQAYNDRIGTEVGSWWKRIDDDAFEILGEKPKVLPEGGKQKTHEFLKEKLTRLKELEGKVEALNADERVKSLQAKIDQLEKDGVGSHWEQTYKADKQTWEAEQTRLKTELQNAQKTILDSKKLSDIDKGLLSLKFNENIPQSAIDATVSAVKNMMINNSRIEGDEVIYLGQDGNRLSNPNFKPMTSTDVLRAQLKDILAVENNKGGGGAPQNVGAIVTQKDGDGKNVDTLNLDTNKITSKSAFIQETERVLKEAGITRGNPKYQQLTDEAYSRYNVKDLPR